MHRTLLKNLPKLIGLLFIFSAGSKLLFPGQATMGLESLELPYWLAKSIVASLIVIEFYLGILLVGNIDLRFALILSTALMFIFTAYMWYLSTLANPPSCGCLGLNGIFKSTKHEALFGLLRNCLLLWILKVAYDYHFPRSISGAGPQGEPVKI